MRAKAPLSAARIRIMNRYEEIELHGSVQQNKCKHCESKGTVCRVWHKSGSGRCSQCVRDNYTCAFDTKKPAKKADAVEEEVLVIDDGDEPAVSRKRPSSESAVAAKDKEELRLKRQRQLTPDDAPSSSQRVAASGVSTATKAAKTTKPIASVETGAKVVGAPEGGSKPQPLTKDALASVQGKHYSFANVRKGRASEDTGPKLTELRSVVDTVSANTRGLRADMGGMVSRVERMEERLDKVVEVVTKSTACLEQLSSELAEFMKQFEEVDRSE